MSHIAVESFTFDPKDCQMRRSQEAVNWPECGCLAIKEAITEGEEAFPCSVRTETYPDPSPVFSAA